MKNAINIAVTSKVVRGTQEEIWRKLGFYEHVNKKPPFLLRTVLPVPTEVEGRHGEVGDLCRCRYSDGGYLTKRMTRIVDQRRIEFEIVEQSIRWQASIKLRGGFIGIHEYQPGACAVTMLTYFQLEGRVASCLRWPIAQVIKYMHRFVMQDLEEQVGEEVARGECRLDIGLSLP